MRRLPFGLIVAACILTLGRSLLSPELVLLPADLVKQALPFADGPQRQVQNRLIADVMEQFYPYYSFAREELLNGRLPLWNPYLLNGTPFLATAVSAVFSPLNLLLLPIPIETSYEWAALFKLLVAAGGLFVFLRRIGLSEWGAAAGAAAYSFSGYQVFFLLYPNTAVSMCMGWGLWAAEGVLQRASPGRVGILAAIVCVSILGGHPECSMLALMAWTLYVLVRDWKRSGGLLAGSLLGVMMSAVVLLPFVELVLGGGTLELRTWEGRNPLFIPPRGLPALLFPYALGCPSTESHSVDAFFGMIRVGLIPLAMALATLFPPAYATQVRALWAGVAAAFVILFGIFPFFDLFTLFPLLENANHLHSALVMQTCLAGLVGIGVEMFSTGAASPRRRQVILGVALGVGLAGLAAFVRPAWNSDALSGSYCFGPWRLAYPLYPLLGLGCLACLFLLKRRQFAAGALGLTLVTGVFFALGFNPTLSRELLDRSNPTVRQLAPHGHDRVAATGVATLLPNYGMSLGLRDARGYESLVVRRVPGFYEALVGPELDFHHFIPTLDERRLQLLRTMGVSRILSPEPYELGGLVPLSMGFPYLFAVEGSSRVELSRQVKLVSGASAALHHVRSRPSPDETVVESVPGQPFPLETGLSGVRRMEGEKTEWISDLPNRVEVETTTRAPALLVLRDTDYTGWTATLDGVEVPIWRTDYLFRGVVVPAGRHIVRFEFRPLSFRAGAALSVLSWLIGLGLFLAGRIHWFGQ